MAACSPLHRDPFRQQLVRGGRSWLLRQPVVVLGRGGVIAVRAAHVRPLVTSPGHHVGDVVDAATDAEQVIGVTARLISTERPAERC